MGEYFVEESRRIEVFDTCEVLVVGGGSAGHSAAIAAARAGCKDVVLLERYGYMGGDVTGGYVIMVPNLSWRNKSFVRGLQEEWFTRMNKIPGAVLGPDFDELGREDPEAITKWRPIFDTVSHCDDSNPRVVRAVYFEPNQLKIEMDKMLKEEEARIRVYCHCWAAAPIVEDNTVKGVIFESKQGRMAIKAKVVIDATGDGDIFSQTKAPFNDDGDKDTRSTNTALVFRVGGVDYQKFFAANRSNPAVMGKIMGGLGAITGCRIMPLPSSLPDVVWFNNWIPQMNCIKVKDLTQSEFQIRTTIREVIDFMKQNAEGFSDAYLYDIAPQVGVRCSRRLDGEYMMKTTDFAYHREFDDVIAWHSTICRINDSAPIEIPYRAILPRGVDNLICPGRHISADNVAIDWTTLIPQCVGTGQAAGVAAAVACATGTTAHTVDIKRVQDILVEQDVPLPRRSDVDPELTELCEEYKWGLYTKMSEMARNDMDEFNKYRQP
ncbi:MAG: FAD-dependent oxidoreductase [Parasporobacterium sp.]|nr:FAD-dependent oxidoreductase [Parasporobacterium sp.]